jgi:hypothetical protein
MISSSVFRNDFTLSESDRQKKVEASLYEKNGFFGPQPSSLLKIEVSPFGPFPLYERFRPNLPPLGEAIRKAAG